ncbi:MAG: 23S rRNA (uracil(1939)-C(5))-methyltransferase RlmD [Syntrophomonadaceae bacterium]|nr:23S rRNA (uracil(1939)-C(5))-methyltransferase RlmD [Syntrophomonadaceae bacterium]
MQCRIEGINHKGEGVARLDGKATFVPGAIPGELVDVEIIVSKARYNQALLKGVLETSEGRINPLCPHYQGCGGCAYQHISYHRELEFKRQVVEDSLRRIGKLLAPVKPVIGMDEPTCYRNKVVWHILSGKIGYYQPLSNKLTPIDTCNLISPEMERVIKPLTRLLPALSFVEPGEAVLRQSSLNGELMLVLRKLRSYPSAKVLGALTETCSSIYGETRSHLKLLYGQDALIEEINGLRFRVSPQSFFQINHRQNEKIIDIILDYLALNGNESILDAYCGVGSISLSLAKKSERVLGIESNRQAVDDARANAMINHIDNCEFMSGACEKVLPGLGKKFDAAVIDPPRAGCRPEVIEVLAESGAKRIVYVSCNPATLARDLAQFAQLGYRIREVQPIDMFPKTYHVETVVLMSRVKE